MTCGCNSVNLFPSAHCVNTQQPAGTYPCKYHLPSLKGNLVIPSANTTVDAEVTSTVNMYVGQGISIGDHQFQVVTITDATNVVLKHNGTATPGNTLIAIHPAYACYQYPIVPVGKVTLLTVPTLVGLNDFFAVIASSIVSPTLQALTYGFVGPKHVHFDAEVIAETVNTPHWLGIELPIAPSGASPLPVFSGFIDHGAGKLDAVALLGTGTYAGYAVIGLGGGNSIPDGLARRFIISGEYEV